MKYSATIVIMAHDRVETIGDAIDSVLMQKNINLIISDNSSTDRINRFVTKNYPSTKYIQRKNFPDSSSHFNKILKSITSKYFMIFHDDDILVSDSIRIMISALENDSSLSAVSGNAYVMKGKLKTKQALLNINHSVLINNKQEMAEKYILSDSFGVAPFPGYLYRTSMVNWIVSNPNEGGKHADVSFLMKVSESGRILWLKDFIMYYRIHGGNDSSVENIGDRLSIIRYIKKNTRLKRSDFDYYKFFFYINYLRQNFSFSKVFSSYKYKVILLFVLKISILIFIKKFKLTKN